jgi:hypothetical protein
LPIAGTFIFALRNLKPDVSRGSWHLPAVGVAMVGAPIKPTAAPMQPTNKPRPNPPQKESGGNTGRRNGRLALPLRILISLLIVWHLTAVALAPMSVPPSSQLVVELAQRPPVQWYLDALYLNHGYHFFAPEPGAGHLIRYELFDTRGSIMAQGEFPNLKEQWPRLRYHRHFMLADQAGLPSDDKQYRDHWQRAYLESYARHLLRIHEDADAVRVRRVAHWPIPRNFFLEGRKLTDPEGYETVMEVTQRRSDLGLDGADQTSIRHGQPIDTANRWIGVPR